MTQPTRISDPAAEISAQLQAWLDEVLKLRQEAADDCPAAGASQELAARALLAVRARLDRVEELLSYATERRAQVRQWARDCESAASDGFDEISVRIQRSAVRRDASYSTGREREAEVNLQMFTMRQQARTAQRMREWTEAVCERIRLAHRGLDGTRQDLGLLIRYQSWESNLDR